MAYVGTVSESQRVMNWGIILKYLGHNIQHISGFDSAVANKITRPSYASLNKHNPITTKTQFLSKDIFTTGAVENNEDCLPLYILNLQRE